MGSGTHPNPSMSTAAAAPPPGFEAAEHAELLQLQIWVWNLLRRPFHPRMLLRRPFHPRMQRTAAEAPPSGLSLDCSRRPAPRTPDAPVITLPPGPLPSSPLPPIAAAAATRLPAPLGMTSGTTWVLHRTQHRSQPPGEGTESHDRRQTQVISK